MSIYLRKSYWLRCLMGVFVAGTLYVLSLSNSENITRTIAEMQQESLQEQWQGVVPRVSVIDAPTEMERANGVDVRFLLIDTKQPLSTNPDGSTNFVAKEVSINSRATFVLPFIVAVLVIFCLPVSVLSLPFWTSAIGGIVGVYFYSAIRLSTILRYQIDVVDPATAFVGMGSSTAAFIGWCNSIFITNTISFVVAIPLICIFASYSLTVKVLTSRQESLAKEQQAAEKDIAKA